MKSIKIRCGHCGLMNDPDSLICARCSEVIQEMYNGHRYTLNGAQLWGVDSEHPELLPPDNFFPDPDDRTSDHSRDSAAGSSSGFQDPDAPLKES